ncbi:hypothetical protein Syun_027760 [Stephania yunnanensis]|uniref:Uncharacterized protein n=1 Tax=Stephania yunnanensis TaxID=152371 RepID=A0AAP0HN40_9MAGN
MPLITYDFFELLIAFIFTTKYHTLFGFSTIIDLDLISYSTSSTQQNQDDNDKKLKFALTSWGLFQAKLQRKRLELTQATPDQPVDDEAVYLNVAGECPKGRVYGLGSLWRKKRRYAYPGASTSQMPEMNGGGGGGPKARFGSKTAGVSLESLERRTSRPPNTSSDAEDEIATSFPGGQTTLELLPSFRYHVLLDIWRNKRNLGALDVALRFRLMPKTNVTAENAIAVADAVIAFLPGVEEEEEDTVTATTT